MFLVILCTLLLADSATATTFRDDTGTEISTDKRVRRIVCLYAAFNEILDAMGLSDRIVGRTKNETLPDLKDLPSIGTHMRPNVEQIVALQPDLVIQSLGRKDALLPVEQLRKNGIPVVAFAMHSFDDLFVAIESIGAACGAQEQAAQLSATLRTRLERVEKAVAATHDRPGVFFEVRYPNLLAAGTDSIVNDIIERAGGRNIITINKKLARPSEEIVLALDPDFYLQQQGPMNPNPSPLSSRPHYRTISAVRNNKVFVVDEHLYSRPGPGSVAAVEQLALLLHPGLQLESDESTESQ